MFGAIRAPTLFLTGFYQSGLARDVRRSSWVFSVAVVQVHVGAPLQCAGRPRRLRAVRPYRLINRPPSAGGLGGLGTAAPTRRRPPCRTATSLVAGCGR